MVSRTWGECGDGLGVIHMHYTCIYITLYTSFLLLLHQLHLRSLGVRNWRLGTSVLRSEILKKWRIKEDVAVYIQQNITEP